ncbi:MAG: hypothetical protein KJ950_09350 [Proteobacteria bacterium]|nr:hypothetical protein [Pseudomonadota bacterium]MBU1687639.1 hypothetical protein [Pseudomonadota bacterium]
MKKRKEVPPIVFGLDRQTDEKSLVAFIERFAQPRFLSVLVSRLTDDELIGILDHLTMTMQRHLVEEEYHHLFLDEPTAPEI